MDDEAIDAIAAAETGWLGARIRALDRKTGRMFIRTHRILQLELLYKIVVFLNIIRFIIFFICAANITDWLIYMYERAGFEEYRTLDLISFLFVGVVLEEIARFASQYCLLEHKAAVFSLNRAEDWRQPMQKFSEAFLERVRKRAHDIRAGNNAVIILDSDNNSVTQNVGGAPELAEALSMLLAYFRETDNKEGEALASELVREAAKQTPDKGRLMEIWTQIVAIAPGVTAIAGVVKAVTALFA